MRTRLLLLPRPILSLNPPAGLGFLPIHVRKDATNLGKAFRRDVVGFGQFGVELLSVAVFLRTQGGGTRLVLERQVWGRTDFDQAAVVFPSTLWVNKGTRLG
jgi:hypothetical protein